MKNPSTELKKINLLIELEQNIKRYQLFRVENNSCRVPDLILHTSYSKKTNWTTWQWPQQKPKVYSAIAWAKFKSYRTPQEQYEFLKRNISNKEFSIGTSSRGFASASWIAVESDNCGLVDEENYQKLMNMTLFKIINDYEIPVHILLSGNRSIHLHVFFKENVPNKCLDLMKKILGAILFFKDDSNSLSSCMRLPGSIHQATGKVAHFLDCSNSAAYVSTVKFSGEELFKRLKKIVELIGSKEEASSSSSNSPSYLNSSMYIHTTLDKENTAIKWSSRCQESSLFTQCMQTGFSRHQFQKIVGKLKMAWWLTVALQSKQKAHSRLMLISELNIDADGKILKSRLNYLNYIFDNMSFETIKRKLSRSLSPDDETLIDNCINTLRKYKEKNKSAQFDVDVCSVVARRLMMICRFGRNHCCGTAEIAELIKGKNQKNLTRSKLYMDLICSYATTSGNRHQAISPLFLMTKECITNRRAREWQVIL